VSRGGRWLILWHNKIFYATFYTRRGALPISAMAAPKVGKIINMALTARM
jgi:hypothetical protein